MHSSKYLILGFTFSEKSWIYLLATQLALSNGTSSLISSISGLVAGLVYGIEGLGLMNYRLPNAVYVYSHFMYRTSTLPITSCRMHSEESQTSSPTFFLRLHAHEDEPRIQFRMQPTETMYTGEGPLSMGSLTWDATSLLQHLNRRLRKP